MEGDRRIVLFEPGPIVQNTSLIGECKRQPPTPHVVYAVRNDKPSAAEGMLTLNIQGGEWQREYTIRQESLPVKPTEDWWLEDEDGTRLDIEGIAEKSSGHWARLLVITCVRTNTANI